MIKVAILQENRRTSIAKRDLQPELTRSGPIYVARRVTENINQSECAGATHSPLIAQRSLESAVSSRNGSGSGRSYREEYTMYILSDGDGNYSLREEKGTRGRIIR